MAEYSKLSVNKETWKSINGYEGIYEISNFGNVKSLSRIVEFGNNKRTTKEKLLKPNKNRYGYIMVSLSDTVKTNTLSIHRLVANAFIDKIEGKDYVNHKDGIKENNFIDNLEWCTISENQKHALLTVLRISPKGINHYNSRFSKEDILFIRSSNLSENKLSLRYNVNRATIGKIKRFERYKSI